MKALFNNWCHDTFLPIPPFDLIQIPIRTRSLLGVKDDLSACMFLTEPNYQGAVTWFQILWMSFLRATFHPADRAVQFQAKGPCPVRKRWKPPPPTQGNCFLSFFCLFSSLHPSSSLPPFFFLSVPLFSFLSPSLPLSPAAV